MSLKLYLQDIKNKFKKKLLLLLLLLLFAPLKSQWSYNHTYMHILTIKIIIIIGFHELYY